MPLSHTVGSGTDPATTTNNQLLVRHVVRRVTALQSAYINDSSAAAASLARLRRAVNREPGADSSVWADTFDGFPQELLGRGDEPSRFERANHTAITLFAIHQQSQRRPMHRPGIGIGRAVRDLAEKSGSTEAVLRRFQALGTASTFDESAYHARGLITQLRSAAIGLDYGLLASELVDLQSSAGADRVRLRWGRDYYRITVPRPDADEPSEAAGPIDSQN